MAKLSSYHKSLSTCGVDAAMGWCCGRDNMTSRNLAKYAVTLGINRGYFLLFLVGTDDGLGERILMEVPVCLGLCMYEGGREACGRAINIAMRSYTSLPYSRQD